MTNFLVMAMPNQFAWTFHILDLLCGWFVNLPYNQLANFLWPTRKLVATNLPTICKLAATQLINLPQAQLANLLPQPTCTNLQTLLLPQAQLANLSCNHLQTCHTPNLQTHQWQIFITVTTDLPTLTRQLAMRSTHQWTCCNHQLCHVWPPTRQWWWWSWWCVAAFLPPTAINKKLSLQIIYY